MDTESYWSKTESLPRHRELEVNASVDAVVIGGGITGITAAYLLKRAGKTVALLERGRLGGFDTANTSAHLTYVTDERLHVLASTFGKEVAKAVWNGGRAAIDQISKNIHAEEIQCEFGFVPGYLHADVAAPSDEERAALSADCKIAKELGFECEAMESIPGFSRVGLSFPHQAKFHPRKYLKGLLQTIPGDGSYVFENTAADEIEDRPLAIKCGSRRIGCDFVIIATHNPLTGKTNAASAALFQTKLFLYTSYVIGARISQNQIPEGLYWDTGDPYHYLRIDKKRGFDYAMFGGEDHKTGQEDKTSMPYARLEAKLQALIPGAKVDSRWSGQVIATSDGLPYIGETATRQFAITGFDGNGITFGTLGAMMAVDRFFGRSNPWQEIFDVHRKTVGGAWDYLRENADYPYYLVRGWLRRGDARSVRELRRNQGRVIELEGKKIAAYCDAHGKVSLCSAICTHLKCIVAWNEAEKTWDCPCHVSRFAATGEVLTGPAELPLEKISLEGLHGWAKRLPAQIP